MFRRLATSVPRRAITATRTNIPYGRAFTIATRKMAAGMPLKADPPVSTELPSDAFQLLAETDKAGAAEDALFDQQVKDVEAWWASARYEGIKRPYSAADVVSKRGSQQVSYPSSIMARKLFNLVKERMAEGKPLHTRTLHGHCNCPINPC